MSLRFRRYLPAFVLIAVIAGAVYLERSDRLGGYAVGQPLSSGCGGGEPQVDTTALGVADAESIAAVREIAALPAANPSIQDRESMDRLASAILGRRQGAMPAAADFIQETGCWEPGSAYVAALLAHFAAESQTTTEQRSIIADILITSAEQIVAVSATETGNAPVPTQPAEVVTEAGPFAEVVVAIQNGGDPVVVDRAIQQVETTAADQRLDRVADGPLSPLCAECAIRAIRSVRDLVAAGVTDPAVIADRAGTMLINFSHRRAFAVALVELMDAAAPAAPEWAARIEAIASDTAIAPAARGFACRAAVRRGVAVEGLRTQATVETPVPIMDCLFTRHRLERSFIEIASSHKSSDVRIEALIDAGEHGGPEVVETTLPLVFNTPSIAPGALPAGINGGNIFTDRERFTMAVSIAQVIARHPELSGSASARFAEFTSRPGHVAQPFEAIIRSPIESKDVPVETILQRSRVERNTFEAGSCDAIIEPGDAQQAFDRALPAGRTGSTICARSGVYTGRLTIREPGTRLVALMPGQAALTDNLVIEAPAVIVGLRITGRVVVRAQAAGTVIAASTFEAPAVSATNDVLLAGNAIAAAGRFVGTAGPIDVSLHVPASAQSLRIDLDTREIQTASGQFHLGWVASRSLSPRQGTSDAGRDRFSWLYGAGFGSDLPASWLARQGYAPFEPPSGPGKVEAQMEGRAAPEGARMRDAPGEWKPVYSAQQVKGIVPAILVPMETGPWSTAQRGMIFVLEPRGLLSRK